MHHYLFIHSLFIRIGVNSSLAWETDSTGNSVFKCSICLLFSGLPRQLAPSAPVTRLAAQKKKFLSGAFRYMSATLKTPEKHCNSLVPALVLFILLKLLQYCNYIIIVMQIKLMLLLLLLLLLIINALRRKTIH